MIWHIKQCKDCHVKKCKYKANLKAATDSLTKTHVMHNCPEYKKLFKVGQRVEIRLFTRVLDEYLGYVWEPSDLATGLITGNIYRGRFWEIQLDKSVTLVRNQKVTNAPQDRIFNNYIKPAKDITVIEGEFGKVLKPWDRNIKEDDMSTW